MSRPVIAAIEPRHEDVATAALGALLAKLLDRPLVLASLYPVELGIENLIADYADELCRRAQEAVDGVATTIRADLGPGFSIETRVVAAASSPAAALHDLAAQEDASALILGSSRRGAVGRVMPSAVTDRLLHGAPCPVAIAPVGYSTADAAKGLRTVAIAFTDSPDGHAALAVADALARAAHARERVLVVGEPIPTLVTGVLTGAQLEAARDALDNAAEEAGQTALAKITHGAGADARILSGSVAEALATASADRDLLVCGSRGHGPLRTLMLGGVSHELVRKARCPVLVVPLGASVAVVGGPAFVAA